MDRNLGFFSAKLPVICFFLLFRQCVAARKTETPTWQSLAPSRHCSTCRHCSPGPVLLQQNCRQLRKLWKFVPREQSWHFSKTVQNARYILHFEHIYWACSNTLRAGVWEGPNFSITYCSQVCCQVTWKQSTKLWRSQFLNYILFAGVLSGDLKAEYEIVKVPISQLHTVRRCAVRWLESRVRNCDFIFLRFLVNSQILFPYTLGFFFQSTLCFDMLNNWAQLLSVTPYFAHRCPG